MSISLKTRGLIRTLAILSALAAVGPQSIAYAQRQRFPSPVTVEAAPTTSTSAYTPPASTTPPPTFSPLPNSSPTPIPTPSPSPYYSAPSGTPPYGSSPYGSPVYDPAPALGPGPVPVTDGTVLGPTTAPSLSGGVQLPPPQWDPYAPPGLAQQPMLLPEDPYLPGSPSESIVKMRRMLQELRVDYTFLSATGTKKFGTNDLDLSATFAFPFLYNQDSPLLVKPGFTFNWLQGPESTIYPYGLPPRVYDAYLSSAWNPQVTPWLGGELEFRIGVYSDFINKLTEKSLRYTGRGLFVLGFSPTMKIKAGIIYYDRVKVKILPAGGLIWTPSDDVRFDIFFPEPRFAKRLTMVSNTELWYYIRGEYGGDSWTMQWTDLGTNAKADLQTDYNDIRIAMGLEFDRLNVLDGHVEFGVAVNREIIPDGPIPEFKPSTTFFLGAGLAY